MRKYSILIVLTLYTFSHLSGQVFNPVAWNFQTKQINENTFELVFNAKIDAGWHMYGLNIPEGGPVATSFTFTESDKYKFISNLNPSKSPKIKHDATFEMEVELFSNSISFSRTVTILDPSFTILEGYIEFMACDDARCLPPKEESFSFELISKITGTNTKKLETNSDEVDEKIPNATMDVTDEETKGFSQSEEHVQIDLNSLATNASEKNQIEEEPINNKTEKSLFHLFLISLLAGFGALLTPCVYPIIPLTVSFFMRDSSRSKAIFNGIMFGFSIVFIYTMVGLIVGVFKVDLVRLIASHWLPNILFFLIFIALASSFFGMFEITLPGSLSNKIDQQADKGGILGPFFMALATVIISFSCTGPIVGVVLGSALQGEIIKPIVGMLGFSISFALPFTLLALFPGFMKKLPKSGGWLNSVKVFFAFILVAFSLVFITNLGLDFVTRNVILSLYIVIFAMLGFYLIGKIKFSHDSPLSSLSVPRLMLAIASFAVAIYLIPGLFGAPLKAFSPFLPEQNAIQLNLSGTTPASVQSENITQAGILCDDSPKYSDFLHLPHGLKGYFDYEEALACAKKINKPVLLDFAGHSCKNCKKMYAEVWSDQAVLNKLQNDFIIAALYTDDRTKLSEEDWVTSKLDGKLKNTIGKKFNDLQITKFSSNALPLYAIVDPNGKIITNSKPYHTYSNDVKSFIDFLDEGISNFEK